MNRRELFQVVGAALTAQTLARARALHARAAAGELQVLDPHQAETVATVAELIIPRTDTPGARDARVVEFIDLCLAEWLDPAERDSVLRGLADLDARAQAAFGKDFVSAGPAAQTQLVAALDGAMAARRGDAPFYPILKRLTLVGYYTSEAGATEELHEQIVPGRYEPCYPLTRG